MRSLLASTLAVIGLCGSATAAPFAPQHVSADAQWVVHLDLDAWRTTELGERVKERMLNRQAVVSRIEQIKEITGVDVAEDSHGITLYSDQYRPRHGVALVYIAADEAKIAKALADRENYQTSKQGDLTVHSWTAKRNGERHPVSMAFAEGEMVAISNSPAAVAAAVAVLGDKSASIAGKKSPLAAKPEEGSVLLIRADGVAGANLPARSPMVKQIESVSVSLGQQQDDSHFSVRIATLDAEVAESIEDIVEGFAAVVRLRRPEDKDAQLIIDGLKADSRDRVVEISWHAPAKEVLDILEKRRDEVIRNFRQNGPARWFQRASDDQ